MAGKNDTTKVDVGTKKFKVFNNFSGKNNTIKVDVVTKIVKVFNDFAGNNDTSKLDIGTKIFKVFNDVDDKGNVPGYDHKKQLYHILHENGDGEDFYHNEVKDFHADTVKQHLKKKKWKRRTKKGAIQFIQKFAPTELEVEEYVMSLSIEDINIRAITSNLSTNFAPQLYAVDSRWSYCVELPVQRFSFWIAIDLRLSIFRRSNLYGACQEKY